MSKDPGILTILKKKVKWMNCLNKLSQKLVAKRSGASKSSQSFAFVDGGSNSKIAKVKTEPNFEDVKRSNDRNGIKIEPQRRCYSEVQMVLEATKPLISLDPIIRSESAQMNPSESVRKCDNDTTCRDKKRGKKKSNQMVPKKVNNKGSNNIKASKRSSGSKSKASEVQNNGNFEDVGKSNLAKKKGKKKCSQMVLKKVNNKDLNNVLIGVLELN